MRKESLIPLHQLCAHYTVEMSFFNKLNELGLIEIRTIEQSQYVHQDKINDIEKMIRLHLELDINFEGIDTVLNLLEKIDGLQTELITLKNRLRFYENEVQ